MLYFKHQLTRNIGKLVLQGADVGHINVEEGAELGHSHADPRNGDVRQATAAVHFGGGEGGGRSDAGRLILLPSGRATVALLVSSLCA